MKRAFLVLGPMSSGTRLATEILCRAGCEGDHGHSQRLDQHDPTGTPIVWRRSFPHGKRGEWPAIHALYRRLSLVHGYQVRGVVTVRDPGPMALSQLQRHPRHVESRADAQAQIARAYCEIWMQLDALAIEATVCVYESLVLNPEHAQRALLRRLGLPVPAALVEIRDGNAPRWAS